MSRLQGRLYHSFNRVSEFGIPKVITGVKVKWTSLFPVKKENNCKHISLDSGIQRTDAHKVYLNAGLTLESIHFGKEFK